MAAKIELKSEPNRCKNRKVYFLRKKMGCHSPGMIKGLQGDFTPEGLYPCVYLSIYLFFQLDLFCHPPSTTPKSVRVESFKIYNRVQNQWPRKPRESSFIRLPCSWKNPPPPPHPTYHPTTKDIGVEISKIYDRIYNQQPQTHLSNKFYPYHHLIKCPLPLPRPSAPSRGSGNFIRWWYG